MTKTQARIMSFYLILLGICAALIAFGVMAGPTAREVVLPTATDAFKITIGGAIGALSAILGVGRR